MPILVASDLGHASTRAGGADGSLWLLTRLQYVMCQVCLLWRPPPTPRATAGPDDARQVEAVVSGLTRKLRGLVAAVAPARAVDEGAGGVCTRCRYTLPAADGAAQSAAEQARRMAGFLRSQAGRIRAAVGSGADHGAVHTLQTASRALRRLATGGALARSKQK